MLNKLADDTEPAGVAKQAKLPFQETGLPLRETMTTRKVSQQDLWSSNCSRKSIKEKSNRKIRIIRILLWFCPWIANKMWFFSFFFFLLQKEEKGCAENMLESYAINHALQRSGSCSGSLSVTASSKGNWVWCFQNKILKITRQKLPHTSQMVALRYIGPSHKNWWGFRVPGGLKDIESFLVWRKTEKRRQCVEEVNCIKRIKRLLGVCLSALILHHKNLPLITGWRWDVVDGPLNK